jgi:methylated-DNA-[protein]-cysteine S-methyltransferase
MPDPLHLTIERVLTPIGELLIVADADGCLRAVDWADYAERMTTLLHRYYSSAITLEAVTSASGPAAGLRAYFNGDLDAIEALRVATGGTAFQRAVWNALRSIRVGTTMSYAGLARAIGRPTAVRAVGLANGANPVSIVVPCHRVIGTNSTLTGYGGGIERKRWLLAHERAA